MTPESFEPALCRCWCEPLVDDEYSPVDEAESILREANPLVSSSQQYPGRQVGAGLNGRGRRMKLKTIWTLRSMRLRERFNRTGEWALLAVAHRLPRRLAYWSFIDSGVRAMGDHDVVPEVRYADLLQRLNGGPS